MQDLLTLAPYYSTNQKLLCLTQETVFPALIAVGTDTEDFSDNVKKPASADTSSGGSNKMCVSSALCPIQKLTTHSLPIIE